MANQKNRLGISAVASPSSLNRFRVYPVRKSRFLGGMTADPARVQFSFRLGARTKERFSRAAEQAGVDPSAAARQLIELVVQRLESGGDLIDALHELKTTWDVPRKSELQARLEALTSALDAFMPPEDDRALVDKIAAVEAELQQHGSRRRRA